MKRPAILLGSIAIALHLHSPGHAQDGGMNGVWRQIRSNAGECRTCQIEIGQADTAFAVTANNGWSANVRIDQADDTPTASGGGRWRPAGTSPHSGKFFRLRLVRLESRLYLVMTGTGFWVEAVFERLQPKSI